MTQEYKVIWADIAEKEGLGDNAEAAAVKLQNMNEAELKETLGSEKISALDVFKAVASSIWTKAIITIIILGTTILLAIKFIKIPKKHKRKEKHKQHTLHSWEPKHK